jgi:hypothetical protein
MYANEIGFHQPGSGVQLNMPGAQPKLLFSAVSPAAGPVCRAALPCCIQLQGNPRVVQHHPASVCFLPDFALAQAATAQITCLCIQLG